MPDPKQLKVGDKIRFVCRPDEWQKPGAVVDEWDIEFMDKVIESNREFTIDEIDEYGNRWISAIVDGNEHTWAIFEESGWEYV